MLQNFASPLIGASMSAVMAVSTFPHVAEHTPDVRLMSILHEYDAYSIAVQTLDAKREKLSLDHNGAEVVRLTAVSYNWQAKCEIAADHYLRTVMFVGLDRVEQLSLPLSIDPARCRSHYSMTASLDIPQG